MKSTARNAGFTLVELAIVLVIIGLIVGGVLVGQDLIKAATIRSTIGDFEKFNAAVNTFNGKYNAIPGDFLNTKAVSFGFNTAAGDAGRTGADGMGDGDGTVEGGTANSTNLLSETVLFWADLNRAGLIPTRTTLTSTSAAAATQTQSATQLGDGILPRTRLRDAAMVTVFPNGGRNYFGLGSFSTNGTNVIAVADALSVLESKTIDEKLDDGVPLTGVVLSIGATLTTLDTAAAPAAGVCTSNAAGSPYSTTTDAFMNGISCALTIRTSF